MNEIDLCKRLEEFFCDYEIYKEVPAHHGGRCDMYVKKGCLWVSVEAKMQFTPKVIYQAFKNIPYAHYSYVAVPNIKDSYAAEQLCAQFGIGVLKYEPKYHNWPDGKWVWREKVHPKLRRKIVPFRVNDQMKLSVAGAQNNSMSEFKVTIREIASYLKDNDGRYSIKALFTINRYHYSNSRSAQQCITRLCRQGAIKEFEIDGGDFILCETIIQDKL